MKRFGGCGVDRSALALLPQVMTVHACNNLPRTLADAAGRGWAVVGTALDDKAVSCTQYQIQQPTVLVIGACHRPCSAPLVGAANLSAGRHACKNSIGRLHLPVCCLSQLNTCRYSFVVQRAHSYILFNCNKVLHGRQACMLLTAQGKVHIQAAPGYLVP